MTTLQINEVAPRDGFQSEERFIPTEQKIALIDALTATGIARIEATSFVSPKAIPNLRDAADVVSAIQRREGVDVTVLVPNLKGAERAMACGVDEINLVMSASNAHGRANLRMTPEESLTQFGAILQAVRGSGVFINASLSTTFGCPFEGQVPEARVFSLVEQQLALGVEGVTLCDTTGVANPAQVEALCRQVLERFPGVPFTLHFHNTRGMGLANALAAWQAGITRFDASLGGLGGCPFAPGATGNVCTEDLVHMFEQMDVATGVNLPALLDISATLPALIGHETPGQVVKAGSADRRYALP
ncbi:MULTISPECIES: hydroxymethylglutaryl-CoA lyase [unclassified Halomonas]|uniref:hydroxymethylglutaryl-CoA lyase n=1 Tax=unclassified Halomonas TaxID=2609666 RepID=UPI0004E2BF50|nr:MULTISPECIES: hydroxymethylglutaryl-CoA lyase [unclassified Halomonas]KFC50836.1 hydroxymethylglutaryl-CoA lyase [Halomonas sp. SUBG004]MCG7576431.1 hydroxymethylglutaryl-CoA lyase [Halomonas sp. MMH1-48]MCG7603494.1 hydroxymethylglutaryl-CoA lyase [Halomonas sp. MM17-34]MCG7612744.1 hydroxymethylglutaryl-CoA lyase [Halomonas sp. MM17-29]MCG7620707.1 hydroxymethylglutaryl-CoA lyase [Halomonas sp. DSH1-27]